MKLSLAIKFNLVSLVIFAICLASVGAIADRVLQNEALGQTQHDAAVLLTAADATQNYTLEHITPLLETQNKYSFVPESVSAFSAVEVLGLVQKSWPKFSYRSTMLNPTNLRDRPSDWEAKVIAQLHDNPNLPEWVGQRDTPDGRALFVARPTRITNTACMQCHSVPEAAPRTMIDKYGSAHGFNWPMNQTIGAEFVSVPMAQPIAQARTVWRTFMISLTAVFVIFLILLNVMVHFIVTRRLELLSRAAEEMSLGKLDGVTLPSRGSDEIASLAISFERMRTSLVEAFKILNEGQT